MSEKSPTLPAPKAAPPAADDHSRTGTIVAGICIFLAIVTVVVTGIIAGMDPKECTGGSRTTTDSCTPSVGPEGPEGPQGPQGPAGPGPELVSNKFAPVSQVTGVTPNLVSSSDGVVRVAGQFTIDINTVVQPGQPPFKIGTLAIPLKTADGQTGQAVCVAFGGLLPASLGSIHIIGGEVFFYAATAAVPMTQLIHVSAYSRITPT